MSWDRLRRSSPPELLRVLVRRVRRGRASAREWPGRFPGAPRLPRQPRSTGLTRGGSRPIDARWILLRSYHQEHHADTDRGQSHCQGENLRTQAHLDTSRCGITRLCRPSARALFTGSRQLQIARLSPLWRQARGSRVPNLPQPTHAPARLIAGSGSAQCARTGSQAHHRRDPRPEQRSPGCSYLSSPLPDIGRPIDQK